MINIAELLEDAPKGLKLYSPLFGDVEYSYIGGTNRRIWVCTKASMRMFSMDGRYCFTHDGNTIASKECLLFPSEDCRTWEGWKLPVKPKFKAGDWVVTDYGKVSQVVSVDNNGDGYTLDDGVYFSRSWCDMYHLWTIQDAKDGDVLVSGIDNPFIYNGNNEFSSVGAYVGISRNGIIRLDMFPSRCWTSATDVKPATKEQCNFLFDRLKEECYEWDCENKELRRIIKPKFKVGDWVVIDNCHNSTYQVDCVREYDYMLKHTHGGLMPFPFSGEKRLSLWTIADAKDGDVICTPNNNLFIYKCKGSGVQIYDYCGLYHGKFEPDSSSPNGAYNSCDGYVPATKEQRDLLFAKMKEAGYTWDADKKELLKIIQPKFKAGDNIKTGNQIDTIAEIDYATRSYCCESGRTIWFENQDLWHLAPKPHYDIANFKAGMPVLVRNGDCLEWEYVTFSHYRKVGTPFCAGGQYWFQCIPFNGDTKHLLGTTDMCDECYINW